MNNELVSIICYQPKNDMISKTLEKYVCFDGYIHVRLADINKTQWIKGFEKKLMYIISYLFHTNHVEDIKLIEDLFDSYFHSLIISPCKFKGIKILNNYKKSTCNKIGDVDDSIFPVNENGLKGLLINYHLDKIGLIEFLLNDKYSILVQNKKENREDKFDRKQNKKDSTKVLQYESDFVELW